MSSRQEYIITERRHTRLFSFFITAAFFSLFLVISYYITWNRNKDEDFIADLTLAVDLGNSTISTSQILPSLKPSSKISDGASSPTKVETVASKQDYETLHSPVTNPNDVLVPIPNRNKKKKATPKPIPKALFKSSSSSQDKNSKRPKSLFSKQSINTESGGNKLGRPDGIEGGSQDLSANGISVTGSLRSRKVINYPTFKEKFKKNSLVRVEVRVDSKGNVYFLRFGRSTTTDPYIQSIVKDKLQKLKFVSKEGSNIDDQFGVLEFRLRVQ